MSELDRLPRFACGLDKTPLVRWANGSARADVDDSSFPLVGVLTGEASGFDVLDVDVEGLGWLDGVWDRLPPTRVQATRSGGRHLFFRHALGLRCSASRIALGVDVRDFERYHLGDAQPCTISDAQQGTAGIGSHVVSQRGRQTSAACSAHRPFWLTHAVRAPPAQMPGGPAVVPPRSSPHLP